MQVTSKDNRLPINKVLDTFHKVKNGQGSLTHKAPKLENTRISVTRSLFKGISQASKMSNPATGLHRCIYPNLDWNIAWHNFQYFVVNNYPEIQAILSSIPRSRGQPTKGLKKMLKWDVIRQAYALYIEVLGSWKDPRIYSEIFRIQCCDGMHNEYCFQKWNCIINFLQSRMESKKWLRESNS